MAQPDFEVLGRAITDVTQQLSLLRNIPAVNQGALIAGQIQELQLQQQQHHQLQQQQHQQQQQQHQQLVQMIQGGFQRLETRLDATDKNTIARLSNSTIPNTTTPLSPIFTKDNQVPNAFPETLADVTRLNGDVLAALLVEYGQPSDGNVAAKRKRFRRYIGVVIDLG